MSTLSQYSEYVVASQAPARRWTHFTDRGQAAYVFDLLGALAGWSMLLGRVAGGSVEEGKQWRVIARKGV